MKRIIPLLMAIAITLAMFTVCSVTAQAAQPQAASQEEVNEGHKDTAGDSQIISAKAIASAIVVGLVGTGGALAMGTAIGKCAESMARQPEMANKINSTMMLGIVFIETAIIYALVIAILIIFVL